MKLAETAAHRADASFFVGQPNLEIERFYDAADKRPRGEERCAIPHRVKLGYEGGALFGERVTVFRIRAHGAVKRAVRKGKTYLYRFVERKSEHARLHRAGKIYIAHGIRHRVEDAQKRHHLGL